MRDFVVVSDILLRRAMDVAAYWGVVGVCVGDVFDVYALFTQREAGYGNDLLYYRVHAEFL